MSDGLGELAQRRDKASQRGQIRRQPASKHAPAPVKPTPVDELPGVNPIEAATSSGDAQPATSSQKAPPRPPSRKPTTDLIRQTVYLDDLADELLEDIRAASRPRRVDANRSAVIRLALRRLRTERTPAQIVDDIEQANRAAGPQRPGRRLV